MPFGPEHYGPPSPRLYAFLEREHGCHKFAYSMMMGRCESQLLRIERRLAKIAQLRGSQRNEVRDLLAEVAEINRERAAIETEWDYLIGYSKPSH